MSVTLSAAATYPVRTIWIADDVTHGEAVCVLNQLRLPHVVEVLRLHTLDDACTAIATMVVRGAGLIGNTAAYGMWLAARETARQADITPHCFDAAMRVAAARLKATRPTATNLAWAVDAQAAALATVPLRDHVALAVQHMRTMADALMDSECAACRRIGEHGLPLIRALAVRKTATPDPVVHILTHCNAGKLAFAGYGSALAPVYAAHDAGLAVHVWVDETRPRNQGAQLTAWELCQHGVPHTLIADNTGGHLMQHGMVDMVITGADRVTRQGDAANKIGTYLKALAAQDNNVPFYVALPASTFDLHMADGLRDIPIEERSGEEVRTVQGLTADGQCTELLICPQQTPARNWGFDVTPARLITGFICEHGVCAAHEADIMALINGSVADGVVKFSAMHTDAPAPSHPLLAELNALREQLFARGFIGVTAQGVGYGNVSIRADIDTATGTMTHACAKESTFIITGSGTGGSSPLGADGYCTVTCCNVPGNAVVSHGPVPASSESMTHGVIYAADPFIGCVIHVHSRSLFDVLLRAQAPSTPPQAAYGTPAMAEAVRACVQAVPDHVGLVVMTGHDQGVLAFGPTMAAALAILQTGC